MSKFGHAINSHKNNYLMFQAFNKKELCKITKIDEIQEPLTNYKVNDEAPENSLNSLGRQKIEQKNEEITEKQVEMIEKQCNYVNQETTLNEVYQNTYPKINEMEFTFDTIYSNPETENFCCSNPIEETKKEMELIIKPKKKFADVVLDVIKNIKEVKTNQNGWIL